MTWPPPPDSSYWNRPKKERDEYDAVVERDKGWCVECGSWNWGEFHHVIFGAHKREVDRGNMVLLCSEPCHGTGIKGAHGVNRHEKEAKYLAYLLENEENMKPKTRERAEKRLAYLKGVKK